MLTLHNINFCYHGRNVLKGVDLKLRAGEVVALMGPSGVGKTTLLKLAAGLLMPSNGLIANMASQQTVLLWQSRELLSWRNALDNAALGLELQAMATPLARQRARYFLSALGLADALNLYPWELSGGMYRRVALAQVLSLYPQLLLLDEPLTGLDLPIAIQAAEVIRAYAQKHQAAVLISMHGLEEALASADRIIFLNGKPASIGQEMVVDSNDANSYSNLKKMILGGDSANSRRYAV